MKLRLLLPFKKQIVWHCYHGTADWQGKHRAFPALVSVSLSVNILLFSYNGDKMSCSVDSTHTAGLNKWFPSTVYSAVMTATLTVSQSKNTNIFLMSKWLIISVYHKCSNKPTTAMSHLIYCYWHCNLGNYESMWFKEEEAFIEWSQNNNNKKQLVNLNEQTCTRKQWNMDTRKHPKLRLCPQFVMLMRSEEEEEKKKKTLKI